MALDALPQIVEAQLGFRGDENMIRWNRFIQAALCVYGGFLAVGSTASAAPKAVTPAEVCPKDDQREFCQNWRAGGTPPNTPNVSQSASKVLSSPVSVGFKTEGFNYFDLVIASPCDSDSNALRIFSEQFINSAANFGFVRENRSISVNMSIKGISPGAAQEIATIPLIDFKTNSSGDITNTRCEKLLVKNLFIQQDILLEFTVRATDGEYVVNPLLLATVRFAASFAPYVGSILQFSDSFASKANTRSEQIAGASSAVNDYLQNFKVQKTDVQPIQILQGTKSIAFNLPGGSKFVIAKEPKPYALFAKLEKLGETNISGAFANQTGLDLQRMVKTIVPNLNSFVSKDASIVADACRQLMMSLTGSQEAGNAKRYLTASEALIVKWWVLNTLKPIEDLTRNQCVDTSDVKNFEKWGLESDFLKPTKSKEQPSPTTEGAKQPFEKLDSFLTNFFTEIQLAQNEGRILSQAGLSSEQLQKLTEARIFRVADYLSLRADVRSQSGPLIFDAASSVADGYAVAANLINRTQMEKFGCYRRADGELRKSGIEAEALFIANQDGRTVKVNALIGPAMGGKYDYVVSKVITEDASPATLKAIQSKFSKGCGESGSWRPWE